MDELGLLLGVTENQYFRTGQSLKKFEEIVLIFKVVQVKLKQFAQSQFVCSSWYSLLNIDILSSYTAFSKHFCLLM